MEGVTTAENTESSTEDEHVLPEGTVLGRYTLGRRLGSGGMGVVYEARHQELGRRVALKLLHPGLAYQPSVRTRFLREGKLASRVRHPHVVDVIDLGTHDGTTYLVMEFLQGETLRALFTRRGLLPVTEIVGIMLPVVAAVAAAHDEEIVHRDLKPENIFLVRTNDGAVVPKVLDFGISKALDTEGAESVTTAASLLGTPNYMAPEQAMDPRALDPRSDLYALGVVLYELLSGRVPYTGNGGVAVVMAALKGGCPPPDTLREGLPAGLSAAVMKAVAPQVTDRVPTARALGASLLPFASEEDRVTWARVFSGGPGSLRPTRSADADLELAMSETEPRIREPQSTPAPSGYEVEAQRGSRSTRPGSRSLWVASGVALAIVGALVVPRLVTRASAMPERAATVAPRVSVQPATHELAASRPAVEPQAAPHETVATADASVVSGDASVLASAPERRLVVTHPRGTRAVTHARSERAPVTGAAPPAVAPRVTMNNAPLID